MGIAYDDLGEGGLVKVTVVGQASRTEHAVAEERAREDIRVGRLKALIIDASAAEVPANPSISREIWEDFLATLDGRPFAYIAPSGSQSAEREAMIRELVEEWSSTFRPVDSVEEARRWCLDEISGRGTG
jgi:hypothetical protein